jgi:hypothetical protein
MVISPLTGGRNILLTRKRSARSRQNPHRWFVLLSSWLSVHNVKPTDLWFSYPESVAQAARKPLFVVTVADVGLEPAEVEMNLKKIFDLANAWEAVLLL